jgi:superfamily II RNA helicase
MLQPAIFFSFDRTDCEVIAQFLVEKLESAEEEWKKTSSKWKAKLAEVENWRKMDKVRTARREKEMKQKKDHDAPREDTSSYAWQATFNEDDPLPETIQELAWISVPTWAVDALRRGVAVHHAGMSKAYRVTIEK